METLVILEFAVIILLQCIGIGLHVMQKIITINKNTPELTRSEVIASFWEADAFTLVVSFLVLMLHVVAHIVFHAFFPDILEWHPLRIPFLVWAFIGALLMGYAGQRLIYKFLGSMEVVVNEKIKQKRDEV